MIAVFPSEASSPIIERSTHSSSTLIHFHTSSLSNNNPPQIQQQHSMIEESGEETREESHLTPFIHQVAGSGALIKVDKGRICKPLISRELEVYESIQSYLSLLSFVPTFHGTLDLDCQYLSSLQWKHITKNNKKEPKGLKSEKEEKSSFGLETEQERSVDTQIHPWSKLMHSKQKDLLKSSSQITKPPKQRYLILQDLTYGFQKPCILDIKMGTRQFGDNATEEKRLSKEAKRIATTSSTLGIRLCGMQVYCPITKQYKYFDKYDGRKYDHMSLKQVLTLYFNRDRGSGYKVDLNLAQAFLDKLLVLHSILDTSSPYRFYSSSLLFIYEGDSSIAFHNAEDVKNVTLTDVDLKMIDFAHTYRLLADDERDDGYVLGLSSLINLLQEIVKLGD